MRGEVRIVARHLDIGGRGPAGDQVALAPLPVGDEGLGDLAGVENLDGAADGLGGGITDLGEQLTGFGDQLSDLGIGDLFGR